MSESCPRPIADDGVETAAPQGNAAAFEARYRRLLSSVAGYRYSVRRNGDGAWVTDHGAACEAICGYRPDDFTADHFLWYTMIHAEDREAVIGQLARLEAGDDVPPLEHRIVHKDGSLRWIRNTLLPRRDDQGQLLHYDGLIVDITRQRRAEDRFRLLLESTADAMLIVDRCGTILLVNAVAEQAFGYRREELLGESIELLVPEHARSRHLAFRDAFAHRPEDRPMGRGRELAARRCDGSIFPAEISLRLLPTEEGLQVAVAVRDVTDRKRTEDELRGRQSQLLAAQRIQARLMPQTPPRLPGYEIAGATFAADFAAGDYFDYLRESSAAMGIAVADVSGHGLGTALLTATVRAYLRSLAQVHDDLGQVLATANRLIRPEIEDDQFITVILLQLEAQPRRLTFVNAGHPSAYVVDRSGKVRCALESSAMPLGIDLDTQFLPQPPVALAAGDLVVMLTDGVLEAPSPSGEQFGPRRTLELLHAARHLPAARMIEALYRAIREFSAHRRLHDDVTAVIIKVLDAD